MNRKNYSYGKSEPFVSERMKSKKFEEQNCTTITKSVNKRSRLDHQMFAKFLRDADIEDQPMCVISISGQARKGKSFLLNLLRRYIERSGWENNWIGDRGDIFKIDAFKAAKGFYQVTEGIRLYNTVFRVPWNGKAMVIVLMDTQGLFDTKNSKKEDEFLLTLTTLMSSVELFNVQSGINNNELTYLRASVDYAEQSVRANDSGLFLKLQALVLIVRDTNPEEEECYRESIKAGGDWGEEQKKVRDKMSKTFDSVQLYILPRPGPKVMDGLFSNEIANTEIGADFLIHVGRIFREIINPKKGLQPKLRNGGSPLTGIELLKLMACCDNLFATGADVEATVASAKIVEANIRVFYETQFEKAFGEFNDSVEAITSKDPGEVESICARAAQKALEQYKDWTDPFEGGEYKKVYQPMYHKRLKEQTESVTLATLRTLELEEQKVETDKEENTQRKFREYVRKMQDVKEDGENLTEVHEATYALMKRQRELTINWEKFEQLVNGELTRMKSRIQRRSKRMKSTTDERRRHIVDELGQLTNSLDRVWTNRLNEAVNSKAMKALIPLTEPAQLAWQDFKMLTLSEDEIKGIGMKVKSAAVRRYWGKTLTDMEKKYNRNLNEKLWKEFSNYSEPPLNSTTQELDLLPPKTPISKSGRSPVMPPSSIHAEQVDKLVQEFKDLLEGDQKSQGVADHLDYVSHVIRFHNQFFKWCSPQLLDCREELESTLNTKEEDILGRYRFFLAKAKHKAKSTIELKIAIAEEGLKKELTTKHMDPTYLSEFYDKVRNQVIEPALRKSMMDLEPTQELENFHMETIEEKIAASLKKMREYNELSLLSVVLRDIRTPKKKTFFQKLFGR